MIKEDAAQCVALFLSATVGAYISNSEMGAVQAFATIGSGFGAFFGMILSHVFTARGLEKLSRRERLAVNWIAGIAGGFSSAWWLQARILTDIYSVEFCAAVAGFASSVLGVVVACITFPWAKKQYEKNPGIFFNRSPTTHITGIHQRPDRVPDSSPDKPDIVRRPPVPPPPPKSDSDRRHGD
jgi:hypothetical protein